MGIGSRGDLTWIWTLFLHPSPPRTNPVQPSQAAQERHASNYGVDTAAGRIQLGKGPRPASFGNDILRRPLVLEGHLPCICTSPSRGAGPTYCSAGLARCHEPCSESLGHGHSSRQFHWEDRPGQLRGNMYDADTVGLCDPVDGFVGAEDAIRRAKGLVGELSGELPLLVMKMGKVLEKDVENDDMFCQPVTERPLRIVIAVAHCDTEANTGSWARAKKVHFEQLGLLGDDLVPVSFPRRDQRNPPIRHEVTEGIRSDSTARL